MAGRPLVARSDTASAAQRVDSNETVAKSAYSVLSESWPAMLDHAADLLAGNGSRLAMLTTLLYYDASSRLGPWRRSMQPHLCMAGWRSRAARLSVDEKLNWERCILYTWA